MVLLKKARKTFSLIIIPLLISACATTAQYNPTTYKYELNDKLLEQANIKTVIIPHVNLGPPSRKYLENVAPRIDAHVASYLKDNGFKVLPQRLFKKHYSNGIRAFGNPVDRTTGRVNKKTFSRIMHSVRNQLRKESNLDAFVFTDLIEREISFSGGMKHLARWDGVTRKPSLQGPGSGVTGAFDWAMLASAASLQITVYNMELQPLFLNQGGLDATDAIDTRSSSGRFVRRKNILENQNHILEGVKLAFHPLIIMDNWPGNP